MACTWDDPTSYTTCAGDVAKSVAGDAFGSIAQSFGQAADHAVSWLWGQMDEATAVHLGGAGFTQDLGIVGAIAGVVAVGLFVIQLTQSALRRDPGGLGRAVRGLLVAFVGGGVAIGVVNLLLAATDALSNGITQVTLGTDISGLGRLILGAGALTSAVNGSAGLLLLSLACLAAVLVVYAALVIRKVLIVVTAVFAPLAFAGSLADITVSWTRRWIETTVALVFSKLILVLVMVVGYGILIEGVGQAGTGATQEITQVASGVLVLAMAGFAPWLALRVVHFTGEHAQQLHALGTGAVGGVAAAGRSAQKAAPYATAFAGSPAAAGAAGGAGTAAGAGPAPASANGGGVSFPPTSGTASAGGGTPPADPSPPASGNTNGTSASSGPASTPASPAHTAAPPVTVPASQRGARPGGVGPTADHSNGGLS